MILTLYNQAGKEKTKIAASENSTQEREIQGDDILALSFTLYEHVELEVNDYVDFIGQRYRLVERYTPEQKNTQEWIYNVKLYGPESLIKRFLVLNTTDGDAEPVFTLTAPAVEHMRLIVGCINAGLGTTDWKVGTVEGSENIVIDYEGKYCDEALKELAEKAGTEYWTDGTTMNLCRCETGEEITLGYGQGLTGLMRDTADNVKFYTRLFPVGSSRNIDRSKYGHSRLMLPGGRKYVDLPELVKEYGVIHHYEKDSFAGIYPRRTGTVSAVRQKEVKGEDGKLFTIYYIQDAGLDFDPNDCQLPGEVIRMSFQEGSELAGLGTGDDHYFEVNFDSKTKEFEIITIWPYGDGTQLPGGSLIPKAGDRYVLWNLRMPAAYITLAEEELRRAVDSFNARHGIDVARYKGQTDHVWIEDNNIELAVGQRIRLASREFFPETGFRKSRVTKIARRVNLPTLMDIEISDALSRGQKERINDSITDVRNYTRSIADSLTLPDIIRQGESTRPTDNNLFSAARTMKDFLNKNLPGVVREVITFVKGIAFKNGNGIDGDGNATLQSLKLDNASIDQAGHALLESVKSPDFKDGGTLLDGTGFGLWKDKAGRTHVAADIVEARRKAYFAELDVRKFSFTSGDTGYTWAGCRIDSVRKLPGGDYRCFFLAEDDDVRISNDFHVGDQAMARTGNIISKTTQMAQNRYYWRLVTGVDDAPVELEDGRKYHYIDLSDTRGTVTLTIGGKDHLCVGCDTSVENDAPLAGDKLVQLGSQTDDTRQYAYIVYVSTGQRVDYNGINDYDLGSHAFVNISKRGIELNADYLHMTHGGTGQTVNIVNERGAWYQGAVSGHYDRWSHDNATWLCNIEKGKTTTSEPRDGSPEWVKETYGQKGDPGKDGKGVTNFELLLASGSLLYRDGQEHVATLAVSYIKDGEDVSDKIPLSRLVWSRKSEAPPADDQAWGQRHANAGTSISLDYTDMAGKTDIICKLLDKNDKVAAQGMFSF